MGTPSSFRRTASRALVLSAVFAVPTGLLTFFYPPAVEDTVWGYPFDAGLLTAVSAALVLAHLLKAVGFIGLSGLHGAGAITRGSMRVAALGFVVLAVCEAISAILAGVPVDSPAAVDLNNGYGAGSMMEALPSILGGIFIAREKLLPGLGRWSVLLSGAFMVFVVTPALLMGRGAPAYLALTAWSLFYVWIGSALARVENG
jgi:hypothetical protein